MQALLSENIEKNMSAFKRYQSKVFWDQMASHDLEDDRSVERNDPPHYSFNECVCEKEEKEEEDSTKSENDTVDDMNITAIHVCNDKNTKQNACQISLIRDKSITRRRYVE